MIEIALTLSVAACVVIFFWRLAHAQGRKKWFLMLAFILSISLAIVHRQTRSACQMNLASYLQTHVENMDNNYVSEQLGVCNK